jgi:ribosomal protein L37AE/L43A
MNDAEAMQKCPICRHPLVRRNNKPGIVRLGGVSPEDQGLPPFWWFCRQCDEYFDGVRITREDGI